MFIFTIIFNLLRAVMSSELLANIKKIVAKVNKIEDLDGDGKFDEVWERLMDDEDLYELVENVGSNLVNLAIEVAVAIVRRS